MTPKGTKGLKNRNYPSVNFEQALTIPRAIQDQAAGNPVSRVTLAELVGRSPGSSAFSELVMASRAYGLTDGGANATDFSLTELGNRATGADEVDQQSALREAVLNVEPFGVFLNAHNGKRVPAATPLKEIRSVRHPFQAREPKNAWIGYLTMPASLGCCAL